METPTNPSANCDRPNPPQSFVNFLSGGSRLLLQLGLSVFLVTSFWQLLGPEPQSQLEFRIRMVVIGLSYAISVVLGIGFSRQTPLVKLTLVLVCLLLPLPIGIRAAHEFDASMRILEPAKVKDGRIRHEPIGLSYAILPNHQINVRPQLRTIPISETGRKSKFPLQRGEFAIICQMTSARQPHPSGPAGTSVTVQVGHMAGPAMEAFVKSVRDFEASLAASPEIKITRAMDRLRISDFNMLEIETVREHPPAIVRHVFLKLDTFLVYFMLSMGNESDRPIFDDFLKSIRCARESNLSRAWP